MKGIYTKFSNMWKAELEKNYAPKKNNHTRQYLRGSAICLRPQNCKDFTIAKKNTRCGSIVLSLENNTKPIW